MTIHNDYTAQILYSEHQARLRAEAAANRPTGRRPRRRRVWRPWWLGLARLRAGQRRGVPATAS
jgi:hypothetical protein